MFDFLTRFRPQPTFRAGTLPEPEGNIRPLPALGWETRPIVCSEREFAGEMPAVVSAVLKYKRPRVTSFFFDAKPELLARRSRPGIGPGTDPAGAPPLADESTAASRPRQHTRIQPPGDVVKLSERLFYLLQPPLEYLLAGNTMEFPFRPFPYQFAGLAFLFPRAAAVLADEMGLGKTMQAISSVRMLLRANQLRRVLLVCPKPLVTNWLREFKTWAPEIPVTSIQGNQSTRHWLWLQDQSPVKIANYELMTRDQPLLNDSDLEFDLVILDEAQRVKNAENATSKVVRGIRRRRSWALTGTPVENSIDDLVGIFDFVAPGLLSRGMSVRQIRDGVADHILRRTKDVVMSDMPPKLIRDEQLDMTPEQIDSYRCAEESGVLKLNEMGAEVTIKHVFELVLRLKQVCNFDPASGASSKLERLSADLEEISASGQKAIVFSQWVGTLNKIAERIPQFHPLSFHGQIPSSRRDAVLSEFQHNPDRHVLLMSYGAGSVGLNLQFCRYVFLFDRWWNPAIEDQAINRAHRIGVQGAVTVSRMIMVETIEQRIHDILEAKRHLFREILSDHQVPPPLGLTPEEIFGLFNLRTPEGKITAKVA